MAAALDEKDSEMTAALDEKDTIIDRLNDRIEGYKEQVSELKDQLKERVDGLKDQLADKVSQLADFKEKYESVMNLVKGKSITALVNFRWEQPTEANKEEDRKSWVRFTKPRKRRLLLLLRISQRLINRSKRLQQNLMNLRATFQA